MPNENNTLKNSAKLGVEVLEARTVPAAFGPNRGLSIAVGDVIPGVTSYEYVTGTGPGTQALVRVFDQAGILKYQVNPFGDYSGGVFVALGDVNLDGQKEIVVSTAGGTTGRVKVYQFVNNQLRELGGFVPFGPNYVGAVQIATGNVTGDRADEIVVGLSRNGSTVKVFSADPLSSGSVYFETRKIRGFELAYKGGVSIAVGNIDGTENNFPSDPYNYDYEEIMIGKARQEPRIRIVDVQAPASNTRANYFVFDPNIKNADRGITVVAGSTDARRGVEMYVALNLSNVVRVFDPNNGVPYGEFTVPYPTNFGTILNMTINDLDDDVLRIYRGSDLFVVAGDGPDVQIPIIFPGKLSVPAGFNGSRPAP